MCLLMGLESESVRNFDGESDTFYIHRRTTAVVLGSDLSSALLCERNLNTPHVVVHSALAHLGHPHAGLNHQP